ncbi:MAG: type VI secretion system contractile sheath small subunit [Gammaproteobacteria bacterium]
MADNGSVAPKERVNIVYKPAIGDLQEEVELPLKVLVMGDFTQADDGAPLEEREIIDVNKNNLDEVMSGFGLSTAFGVPNRLTGEEGDEIPVELKFDRMADFSPERVAEQVPELAKILELRQALMALKGPLGNVPAMRKTIQDMLSDDDTRSRLMSELGISGDNT